MVVDIMHSMMQIKKPHIYRKERNTMWKIRIRNYFTKLVALFTILLILFSGALVIKIGVLWFNIILGTVVSLILLGNSIESKKPNNNIHEE